MNVSCYGLATQKSVYVYARNSGGNYIYGLINLEYYNKMYSSCQCDVAEPEFPCMSPSMIGTFEVDKKTP